MVKIILALVVSLIPSLIFYFWLRNADQSDTEYAGLCTKVLFAGMLSVIPVTFASFLLNLVESFVLKGLVPDLALQMFHKFIVLAFAEELVKYLTGNKYIKQRGAEVSRLDVVAFLTIAACGFNIIESGVYAVGSDVITVLVRGATALHQFYGLIMGWYVAKYLVTKDTKYMVMGLGIPWFLHGLYDFSLTPALFTISDLFYFLPFAAILATWVIGIIILVKVIKALKDPSFAAPIASGNQ